MGNNFVVSFEAPVEKYLEDGLGKRTQLAANEIEVGIYTELGEKLVKSFRVANNKVKGKIYPRSKPIKIVIDPLLKTIDSFSKDNEKNIEPN